ncbi:hypothetical protein [Streptomyces sp. CBMA29]|uniref:hypothetical protein n=1 Tax=Streptomyces sp. CBMA29 TaxID=1896314 RepID=UPI001661D9E4|nr:hypothetical protein [Streptomyces sp. CBMA29]MBD0740381.1 hypothetical protein [Streptomyces sp. CBMA29]
MGEFTSIVLGFPTVLFGGALVVVVCFWLVVLLGGADADGPGHHGPDADFGGGGHDGGLDAHAHDAPDADGGHEGHGGLGGLLAATGLDGVPVTVVFSLLTALAWFLSLAGSAALDGADLPGLVRTLLSFAVLCGAVIGSWSLTWVLVRPLRRLFPHERPPSRQDFVGQPCVIRTGRVTGAFGQAEVTSPDGSTAVVQVRQSGEDGYAAGSTALIYAYEPDGEFFWVAPFDPYERIGPATA